MASPLTITVSAGAPQTDLKPGAYEVQLLSIEGPRTIFPQTGPNAGKEVEVLDWTFGLDDESTVQGTTSTASGPKSKLYAWLTALLGGTPPAVGAQFSPDDLISRMAIATISIQESGWPRIENLSAMPARRSAQPVAVPAPVAPARAAAPAPAARRAPTPVAAATASDDDQLPF